MLVAVLPGLKRMGRKVRHSHFSKKKIINVCSHTFTPFMPSDLTDGPFYFNSYQPQLFVLLKYF
jgi:hypothetical protein